MWLQFRRGSHRCPDLLASARLLRFLNEGGSSPPFECRRPLALSFLHSAQSKVNSPEKRESEGGREGKSEMATAFPLVPPVVSYHMPSEYPSEASLLRRTAVLERIQCSDTSLACQGPPWEGLFPSLRNPRNSFWQHSCRLARGSALRPLATLGQIAFIILTNLKGLS